MSAPQITLFQHSLSGIFYFESPPVYGGLWCILAEYDSPLLKIKPHKIAFFFEQIQNKKQIGLLLYVFQKQYSKRSVLK